MISRSPAVTSRKGKHTPAFLSFFCFFYPDYPNVLFYPYMCNVVKGHFCVIFVHPFCFLSLILILQPKLNCSLQKLWDKERLCVRLRARACVRASGRACVQGEPCLFISLVFLFCFAFWILNFGKVTRLFLLFHYSVWKSNSLSVHEVGQCHSAACYKMFCAIFHEEKKQLQKLESKSKILPKPPQSQLLITEYCESSECLKKYIYTRALALH